MENDVWFYTLLHPDESSRKFSFRQLEYSAVTLLQLKLYQWFLFILYYKTTNLF